MSKFKYDLGIIGLGYVGLPLAVYSICLLYTSDDADEGLGVDLGGGRII